MENLTDSRKNKLLRIQNARNTLSGDLERGFIKESDIIGLLREKSNYGFKMKHRPTGYRISVLKSIFNSPFVLCDQEYVSSDFKRALPYFLKARYIMEEETLKYYYDNGFISEEEYQNELDELKFCYYESSEEGKKILNGESLISDEQQKIKR